jgi:hypothetical protein
MEELWKADSKTRTFPQLSHSSFEIAPKTPRFQHPFGKPSEDSGFTTAPTRTLLLSGFSLSITSIILCGSTQTSDIYADTGGLLIQPQSEFFLKLSRL